MSSDDLPPVPLIFVNSFITAVFLALASFANHCLLMRDDRARQQKLLSQPNRHFGRPMNAGPVATGGFIRTSSQVSVPRFFDSNNSTSGPTLSTGNFAQGVNAYGGTNITPTSTPLLTAPPRRSSSIRADAPPEIAGPASTGDSSSSVAQQQHQRHSSVIHTRRFQFHFVPTDSDVSSDEDTSEIIKRISGQLGTPHGSFSAPGHIGKEDSRILSNFATDTNDSCRLFKCRTNIFSDERSFFFIATIVCSLIEAATMLIFTYADIASAAVTESSRGTQDIISAPQACSLFVVFASLLHILHLLVEQEISREYQMIRGRLRLGVAISVIISAYLVATIITGLNIDQKASEYVSSTLEVIISGCFLWTGFTLPKKILSFGTELQQTANKVQRVCFLVAFCLTVRFIVFFPLLQDQYGSLGAYAASLFNMVDVLPLAASLLFLHAR